MTLNVPPFRPAKYDAITRIPADLPSTGRSNPSGRGATVGTETILHASCVSLEDQALLILGASGSGKSTLALELIALGATLVSDDRTIVRHDDDRLIASPPGTIAGRIEARHVGLLQLPYRGEAQVTLAIDLDQPETQRLPPRRSIEILDQTVTLLFRPPTGHSTSAIYHCLLQRREAP